MPKPLLPPITGKTPTGDGRNVVVCFANINGTKTYCDIGVPVGLSRYKVRPMGSDDSVEPTIVALTNGTDDNHGDAWIKFERADKSTGYAKVMFDTKLIDWDGNEIEWHCDGIGQQDKGVYLLSNADDVK